MSAPEQTHAQKAEQYLKNTSALGEAASERPLAPAEAASIQASIAIGYQAAQVEATLAVADELRDIATLLRTSEQGR